MDDMHTGTRREMVKWETGPPRRPDLPAIVARPSEPPHRGWRMVRVAWLRGLLDESATGRSGWRSSSSAMPRSWTATGHPQSHPQPAGPVVGWVDKHTGKPGPGAWG